MKWIKRILFFSLVFSTLAMNRPPQEPRYSMRYVKVTNVRFAESMPIQIFGDVQIDCSESVAQVIRHDRRDQRGFVSIFVGVVVARDNTINCPAIIPEPTSVALGVGYSGVEHQVLDIETR